MAANKILFLSSDRPLSRASDMAKSRVCLVENTLRSRKIFCQDAASTLYLVISRGIFAFQMREQIKPCSPRVRVHVREFYTRVCARTCAGPHYGISCYRNAGSDTTLWSNRFFLNR